MTHYRYRCGVCQASTEPRATAGAAHRDGERHRAQAHDGMTPDGEEVVFGPDRVVPEKRRPLPRDFVLFAGLLISGGLFAWARSWGG